MDQPVKLQLNEAAVAALFPEGTTARLELQNAVVAAILRKHIRDSALGPDVQVQIERARTDALNAVRNAQTNEASRALAELGVKKGNWGSIELSAEVKALISAGAKQAVQLEISKVIQEQIEAMAEKLRGTITHDAQAAVNRMVEKEIGAAVKERVRTVMASLALPVT
jgi:5-hydroxyisourate hydrolase-like protein (transthyretin family)